MTYRLCKRCNKLIEDAYVCEQCDSEDLHIMDVLLTTKDGEYTFEEDEKQPGVWYASRGSKKYILKIETVGKKEVISCSCAGFKYRRFCKHTEALKKYIGKDNMQTIRAKLRHSRSDITKLLRELNKGILKGLKYEVAGSYRRGATDSKDLDIVIIGMKKSVVKSRLENKFPGGDQARPGDKNAPAGRTGTQILRWYIPIEDEEIELDFHFTIPIEYEPTLLYFTGSKEFNLRIRSRAKSMGFALNRYGLWNAKQRSELVARSEKDIFTALGMKYVPPRSR